MSSDPSIETQHIGNKRSKKNIYICSVCFKELEGYNSKAVHSKRHPRQEVTYTIKEYLNSNPLYNGFQSNLSIGVQASAFGQAGVNPNTDVDINLRNAGEQQRSTHIDSPTVEQSLEDEQEDDIEDYYTDLDEENYLYESHATTDEPLVYQWDTDYSTTMENEDDNNPYFANSDFSNNTPISTSNLDSQTRINPLDNVGFKTTGVIENDDDFITFRDRSNYNNMSKRDMFSVCLYNLVHEYNVPREFYRKVVRLMNTVIRDHDEMVLEIPNKEPKIKHGPAVESFLAKRTDFACQEFHICERGCHLYTLGDDRSECPNCGTPRYKNGKRPNQIIKLVSVGDILSKLLSNSTTREKLRYRAKYIPNADPTSRTWSDYFDGDVYQNLLSQGHFSNQDDIALTLFSDSFCHNSRGSKTYTVLHLVILNYDKATRYKETYHIQLGVIVSDKKISLDSFLLPILAEIRYLETHGMKVYRHGVFQAYAKCFLVNCGGDIPALALIGHCAPHQCAHPCRNCIQPSIHATNRPNGLYLPYLPPSQQARLRTKEDYVNGDADNNLTSISLLTHMTLFNGPLYYPTDEMHLISRGIGLLVLDLLSVDLTKDTMFYHKLDPNEKAFASDSYPFKIPKDKLLQIGKAVVASRSTMPTSFPGSFEDLCASRQGMRAVDVGNYLTCIVPTLFVPELSDRKAQRAILGLVRGCQIANLWEISSDQLVEMNACFKTFYTFCNKQISLGNLAATVFRPVMHYLTHLSWTIQNLGPLNVFSSRSQERSIGRLKAALTAKMSNQAQPSNVVERFATLSLLKHSSDIEQQANLICPASYSSDTWSQHPNDNSDGYYRQLWEPFRDGVVLECNGSAQIEGVKISVVHSALAAFYKRHLAPHAAELNARTKVKLAGRAWLDDKIIVTSEFYINNFSKEHRRAANFLMFTSPHLNSANTSVRSWFVASAIFYFRHHHQGRKYLLAFVQVMRTNKVSKHCNWIPVVEKSKHGPYAVVSLDVDIQHQVGLIKVLDSSNKFSVVIPDDVLGSDMSSSCGSLTTLL